MHIHSISDGATLERVIYTARNKMDNDGKLTTNCPKHPKRVTLPGKPLLQGYQHRWILTYVHKFTLAMELCVLHQGMCLIYGG